MPKQPRPEALERLCKALSRLPGVGRVTSERLAYHLVQVPEAEALDLAEAIRTARREVRVCSQCFNLDQEDPCKICQDPHRDRKLLLVVEGPREVAAFEQSGYAGLYHVLQGRVSPLEGISEKDLSLQSLLRRVEEGEFKECCLAMNPDLEGEATADLCYSVLKKTGILVTRLARGIPAGASILQVQQPILSDALHGRRKY
ncbi:MAG TPA: recombination protein RecR [Planctomycetes bacterium]|nr:recombination protein RecR [Planctomycetota bacterium]